MSTTLNRLTAVEAKAAGEGLHYDGGGLILQVGRDGARSWLFRYRFANKRREMGLGPFNVVGLAAARQKAQEARRLIGEGKDPIEERRASTRSQARPRGITFAEAARRFITAQTPGWRNPHHVKQWHDTLRMYANPTLGKMDVAAIETQHVLTALEPIWLTMTPTASRLRGRIEAVLGWAKAHHFRTGENPARWKENLDALLAPPNKVHKVEHLAAMPYTEIPAFVTELRESTSITARCLEFTILTACRVNETTGAEWPELALDNGASVLWTIPGSRTKSGREHKVPLVRRARDILAGMRQIQMSQWVFPGIARGEHLSGMAMLMHLRRARAGGLTVHGFRSSFKDWASEQTSFPDFLSEMALGHISGDKVRAAYARSELLDKRREMMTAWATWCYR